MDPISFKHHCLIACKSYVQERIDNAQNAIEQAQQASNDDTKSSAGDKYETTREMMAQEQNKAGQRLAEAVKMMEVLNAIGKPERHEKAQLGSCVKTNAGTFYISTGVGKLVVEGEMLFAVSLQSPVGQKLLGKKAGDSYELNGRKFEVKEVV